MRDRLLVAVTRDPLEPTRALAFVDDPAAGAVVMFCGTVRDHSDAGAVDALEYEAWEERAEAELAATGQDMLRRWPLRRVALLHRTGRLEVSEVSVVVCCSAPHRDEAFAAARHGIDRIKATAPIWKKESLRDGRAGWVMGS